MHKVNLIFVVIFFILIISAFPQTNVSVSNQEASQVLSGNYDPQNYLPSVVINHPDSIIIGIISNVSNDSVLSFLMQLNSFQNRNSGSDTLSGIKGIGAARRWIYQKFTEFGSLSSNRLLPSYLDFDATICNAGHHRNVFAVLPGTDTSKREILIVEAHMDSRCGTSCDTSCYAPGMEDNGSGTILVMELARIMSKYTFDHTIIFSCNTGEEQGLWGSKAWVKYLDDQNIPMMACFNNDMVGGTICGQQVSPPGCTIPGQIDSMNLRIFSFSFANDSSKQSVHKQLARYIKLQQTEKINPRILVPMEVNMQIYEDRFGRSGDHVPFRNISPSVRIMAQHENGDGSGTAAGTQHTPFDIIGYDTTVPPDGIIDSFLVDLNYLSRNIILNGVNLGLLAISPPKPDPSFTVLPGGVKFQITGPDTIYQHYRVGVRSKGSGILYFDTIYSFNNTCELLIDSLTPSKTYYFSVMNVSNNVESFMTDEFLVQNLQIDDAEPYDILLMQNTPNPAADYMVIKIEVTDTLLRHEGKIVIRSISGTLMKEIPVKLSKTTILNISTKEFKNGIYTYSLSIDGRELKTLKMVVNH